MKAEVMINKMQLRGSTEHKHALLDALDHQHWGEDDQRMVFINQLNVSGYWWELAQKIAQETRLISSQPLSSSQIYIADQLAVFPNYPVFISQSIQCLLSGKKPWYLQAWLKQEDLADEPVVLLQHKIFDLPVIFEVLREASQLRKLLSFIKADQLQDLVYSLASVCPALLRQVFENNPLNKSTRLNQSASEWIAEYFSEFSSVVDFEAKRGLLVQLAAGLSAWRFAPQLMNDEQKFKEWFGAVAQIANQKLYPTLALPLAGEGTDPANWEVNLDDSSLVTDGVNQKPLLQIGSDSPSPLPRGRLGGGEDPDQFFIQQTGLLFLINFFKTLTPTLSQRARGQLFFECEESFSTNPWVLLYHAFEVLSQQLKFKLDNSLKDLMVYISQLTSDEFYEQASSLDAPKSMAELIEQKLRSMNLWQSDWIYLAARAEVNQAYINIYLDNSSVNLQLRLAGLDVNPGWVPWLGRVIYFHYGHYPNLAQG